MTPENIPFADRAERVINAAFGGIHHVNNITKRNVGGEFESWKFSVYGSLSTFDFNNLTKLVIAAHEYLVRVEVTSSSPRMVGILLHPRKNRDGSFSERHPTIEQAIADFRK